MILVKPHITEKSMAQAADQTYTFKVDPEATKDQIKEAVERTFKVNVVKVRTTTKRGSLKRSYRTGKYTKLGGHKKAYVTLAPKQSISYFSSESK